MFDRSNKDEMFDFLLCLKRKQKTENNYRIPTSIKKHINSLFCAYREDDKIKVLLNHISHNKNDDAEDMLDDNPRLLLEHSNAFRYDGCQIERVRPYELALCNLNWWLASTMDKVFDKIEGGRVLQKNQYNKCKNYIDNIHTQAPDFIVYKKLKELAILIKNCEKHDVVELLKFNFEHKCELQDKLNEFRNHMQSMTLEGGFFNFGNVRAAFQIYFKYFHSKIHQSRSELFCNQVLGLVQRGLPAGE